VPTAYSRQGLCYLCTPEVSTALGCYLAKFREDPSVLKNVLWSEERTVPVA
jgi:hypothetical protein